MLTPPNVTGPENSLDALFSIDLIAAYPETIYNNQCHKRVNIYAVPPLLSAGCKLSSVGLTFLENFETDSGLCGMIASDLWRMMEVDLAVSL